MLVCGIHDGHNASAALVRDGRLVGALQEERPRRVKNWHGFPIQAVEALLASAGASWSDVGAWVFAGEEFYPPPGGGPGDRVAQLHAYKNNCTPTAEARRLLRETPARRVVQALRGRQRLAPLLERGVPREAIHSIKHHHCHASTAYHGPRAASDVLVMTLDGAGDGLCATVSVPDARGRLELVGSVKEEHSVGILWAMMTSLMGMIPMEHEYKIMGMAPYSTGTGPRKVADKFARAFVAQGGGWVRAEGTPDPNYGYDYWRAALEFDRFDQLCGGLQLFTEEFLAAWVRRWLKVTGRRKLRLSGGVFMNVKLNKVLAELPEVDDIYVFPSCGDETNAIGAAWAWLEREGQAETIEPLGPAYLGVAPTPAEYERAADAARAKGYTVTRPADVEATLAELLQSGEVVARVDGREEFGARALGNRSILADPSRGDVVRLINRAIKCRDFWMPFAPSVLAEAAPRYVWNPKGLRAPYMILAFDSRRTEEVIAACHPEDRSIRPQVVEQAWNPGYHRLISLFAEKTGRGALLNTSFNLHGEPIVSRPVEAVDVLDRSGLNHLAIGPFLVQRLGAAPPLG